MKLRRLALLALSFALVFAFAGCKKAEEKVAEKAAEKIIEDSTGADVDLDDNSVTITGEDGETVEIQGSESELAEDFPSDVPIYGNAKVESSGRIAAGGAETFTAELSTGDGVDQVFEWYKSQFAKAGWESTAEFSSSMSDGESAMLSFAKGDRMASAAISAESGDQTVIVISTTKQ